VVEAATADRVAQPADLRSAPVGADALNLRLLGDWTLHSGVPDLDGAEKEIEAKGTLRRVTFDATGLRDWDSALLTFILGLVDYANSRKLEIDLTGLPPGVRGLTELATAVPKQEGIAEKRTRRSLLEVFGDQMISFADGTGRLMEFIGEAAKSFGRLITGRTRFRRSDLWLFIEEAGVDALQGLTMAFLGAAQLRMFGAQIYVANLIGMSMVAEVGAVMTAIIMAGRTGAAYAASIGTMQVNQEVDALQTMGFVPMDFLVLPRMLALILMMPLLYLYANLLGMLDGGAIAVSVLGLTVDQYVNQLFSAVPLSMVFSGLIKSSVFGLLVAICGCMQGIGCGRSAAAVGNATTSAVVMSLVAIIVADGIFGVINPPLAGGIDAG
jgi:phospholipid/cholesterol/gamma-HCH transport system permease protein